MEFEFVKEAVKPRHKKEGKYSGIVDKWLATDNKTLKFKCKNDAKRKSVYYAMYSYKKSHNHDFTIITRGGECAVYVVRA